MIDDKILTRNRRQARFAAARAELHLFIAARTSKIGGRTADIVDIAFKIRHLCQNFGFPQNGSMATALNNATLMRDNRTEISAAETAALTDEAEFHFFKGGNPAVFIVHRMPCAHIRQIV